MNNFINELCESNNLTVYDFDTQLDCINALFAVPNKESTNQEYFLFLMSESIDDNFIGEILETHSETFMDKLERLEYVDESLRKNSTLILCIESSNVSAQKLLKFEEDPYLFKKNVITYSNDDLIQLTQKLNHDYSNESLNKLLSHNSEDSFESFKIMSTLDNDSHYSLLIKVITKLPFVHFIPSTDELESLENFVMKTLDEPHIKLLDLICDGEFSEEKIDEKIGLDWGSNG